MSQAALTRWLAEIGTDTETSRRRREHWLAQRAADSATLTGILRDLADRGDPIVVETTASTRHAGPVVGVGLDFCALVSGERLVVVALSAIATVTTTATRHGTESGDRMGDLDLTLQEVLADRLSDRPRIVVHSLSGQATSGELAATGHDVVTLLAEGSPRRTIHVATESVAAVTVIG